MVSLVDDGHLSITLEDARHPERLRYRVTFERAPLYRNIHEEYRINESGNSVRSWATIVEESGWISLIRQREPLIDVHSRGLRHYRIWTEDDVVEVLSNTPPLVDQLGPAPAEAAPAGKSRVLYHPEDRSEIERTFESIIAEETSRRKRAA